MNHIIERFTDSPQHVFREQDKTFQQVGLGPKTVSYPVKREITSQDEHRNVTRMTTGLRLLRLNLYG